MNLKNCWIHKSRIQYKSNLAIIADKIQYLKNRPAGKDWLPDLDSNQETSAPEADVLPITPSGNFCN